MANTFNLNVDIPNLELYKQKVNELSQTVKKAETLIEELQKLKLEIEIS